MPSHDRPTGPRRLLRVAGIDVRVHWTFLLLLGWIFASHLLAGHGAAMAGEGVAFIATIFLCVVLHEFGHALVARRFGIRTRDITLYPIGGVARLERMPERPRDELWIAVAGPAVNFAIALGLWLLTDRVPGPEGLPVVGGSFLAKTMYVNLSIGVFNLLPAFPMDGGRVLRALLAMRLDYVRATQIAATAGKVLAVGLGLLGLFGNWFLLFIALFVFAAAQQEALLVQTRALLEGVPVREAMLTRFESVAASTRIGEVVDILLSSEQRDFPVVEDGSLIGMLTRADLLRALSERQRDASVADVMTQSYEAAESSEMLADAFRRMQEAGCSSLPVVREGRLVGLLTLEQVGKWLMVRGALDQSSHHVPGSRLDEREA